MAMNVEHLKGSRMEDNVGEDCPLTEGHLASLGLMNAPPQVLQMLPREALPTLGARVREK